MAYKVTVLDSNCGFHAAVMTDDDGTTEWHPLQVSGECHVRKTDAINEAWKTAETHELDLDEEIKEITVSKYVPSFFKTRAI